jgi:hypothetical protein
MLIKIVHIALSWHIVDSNEPLIPYINAKELVIAYPVYKNPLIIGKYTCLSIVIFCLCLIAQIERMAIDIARVEIAL